MIFQDGGQEIYGERRNGMGMFVKPGSGSNARERECGCCIEVEDSLVLILCGEIDVDNLREALNAYVKAKNAAKADAVE